METFIPYIHEYGYWILIIGALIEGESILLMAGGAAYFGYFSLPTVMLVSFIGAIIHDQLLFAVGRISGKNLLQKSPYWKKKSTKAFSLLHKYNYWLIMGFRFVYGIRTITPIVVGASGLGFKRYTFLTLISAGIWAIVISSLGYLFATILEVLIETFHKYQVYVGIGIGALILIGIAFYKYRTHKENKNSLSSSMPTSKKDGSHEQ